jgi:hypothetical protein
MVLFGNEFDADERAEVGGGLRGGEGDDAFLLGKNNGLTVVGREQFIKERRRACRCFQFPE